MMIKGHMPFVVEMRGMAWLLFCRGQRRQSIWGSAYEYTAWTLHYAPLDDLSQAAKLATGFLGQDIECNPVAWMADNRLHITFAAAEVERYAPHIYDLYHMEGHDFLEMEAPQQVDVLNRRLFNGYAIDGKVYLCARDKLIVQDHNVQQAREVTTPFAVINRLVPHDGGLIITGMLDGEERSLWWDPESGWCRGEILCDGKPVYKCTVYGDQVIHAEKGAGFEDRTLHAGKLSIRDEGTRLFESQAVPWERQPPKPRGPRQGGRIPAPASITHEWDELMAKINAIDADTEGHCTLHNYAAQLSHDRDNPPETMCCADRRAFKARMLEKLAYYYDMFAWSSDSEGQNAFVGDPATGGE